MRKEMLVRFADNGVAVALVDDHRLEEIFLPRQEKARLLGNIYLGTVENVLPGMQAAFVDIGLEKNSFLYVEDAIGKHPPGEDAAEQPEYSISDLVRKNQQITVQVFKEPSGTKGARVTMHPSLPGRYLVLLPRGDYVAVSRRIEEDAKREVLKELIRKELPPQMGAIVRTVAEHEQPETLTRELHCLLKDWQRIQQRASKSQAPALLYQDSDLLDRVIRDTNPADVDAIVVADEEAFLRVSDSVAAIAPVLQSKIILRESRDLFLDYDIPSQLERALQRKVWLKSGGYIIIDQMEALTAIDVNTGKYVGERNLNDTVYKTNLESITEIARQLRLRNIGGIVIIDFIDMETPESKIALMEALKEELKKDRVRITVMGMTQLGLVELTRKKVGPDLASIVQCECKACAGTGRISQLQQLFQHTTAED